MYFINSLSYFSLKNTNARIKTHITLESEAFDKNCFVLTRYWSHTTSKKLIAKSHYLIPQGVLSRFLIKMAFKQNAHVQFSFSLEEKQYLDLKGCGLE